MGILLRRVLKGLICVVGAVAWTRGMNTTASEWGWQRLLAVAVVFFSQDSPTPHRSESVPARVGHTPRKRG